MLRKIIATLIMLGLIIGGGVFAYQATTSRGSDDDKITVTASYYPLYDFAKQVGGDKVTVSNMTPAGAEPHDYEPSPQELIKAHQSSVFVYNGGPMEPWVDSFLGDYKQAVVKANQNITLRQSEGDDGHDHGHDEDHDHEDDHDLATDPHFWLDPILAQQIVNNIRDGLSEADPENSDYYATNATSYNQKLAELDQSFASGLSECKLDTVVSSHGAFAYLAHRYDFEVESIAGIEPDDEPSPAKLAELTNVVRQKNIKYIFFESLVSPRLAETIPAETGADTLVFDPLEGLSQADQEKGRDYISVQQDNLRSLRTALDCQ